VLTHRPRTAQTAALAALALLAAASCGPRPVATATVGSSSTGPGGNANSNAAGDASPASDPVDAWERAVGEAIARARESAVALEYSAFDAPTGARRMASGVVVGETGEVLSVRIDPPSAAAPIVARVASGRRLPARWVATDPETGLTLLRIEAGAARPAATSIRGPRIGAPVLVIGNPFGLAHSAGRGFVAGLNRRLDLSPRPLGGLIQIDAALHPGDSGALVADLHGGWLGVIRSGLAPPAAASGDDSAAPPATRDDHDLGFAIPAADALWVAGQLNDRGRVDRAFLGVSMDQAPANAPDGAPPAEGAVLTRVLADSPAERAGLKGGDRVVAIDGRLVRTPYDLIDRLDRTAADSDVTLDLVRADDPALAVQRLTFRSSRRPPLEPARPPRARDREKARNDDPSARRELAATVERLERRVRELEKEKRDREDAAQGVQR
jgi:S1-C subfamily serine protease